jgi:hypothetical protein
MRVALGGREQMTDQRRCTEIFERPHTALEAPRPGHRSRAIDHSDPQLAAYRTGGTAATGGGAGLFFGGGT